MTNPATLDRRDVAHPTIPLGGHQHIEQDDPARAQSAGRGQVSPAEKREEAYTSLSQPVEGADNALKIDPSTKRVEPA